MRTPPGFQYRETPCYVHYSCSGCKQGFRLPRTMNARTRAVKFKRWARIHKCPPTKVEHILRDAERETRGMTPAQLHTWRLNRLAKILQNLPPEKFDMAIWGMHLGIDHIPSQETNYCGTTACALGHAAMDPVFNIQGLTHEWYQTEDEETLCYAMQILLNGEPLDIYYTYNLGAEFFGLTDDEAYEIFMSTGSNRAEVIEELFKYATNREEIR